MDVFDYLAGEFIRFILSIMRIRVYGLLYFSFIRPTIVKLMNKEVNFVSAVTGLFTSNA